MIDDNKYILLHNNFIVMVLSTRRLVQQKMCLTFITIAEKLFQIIMCV